MKTDQTFLRAEDIAELKDRHSMVRLLQERGIEVKHSGANFSAICPFHEEKTPSLTIFPDNHGFCFGCETHVDVIDLVQKLDGVNFREACVKLGARISTDIPHCHPNTRLTKANNHHQVSTLRRRAKAAKKAILSEFAWDTADIWETSPTRIDHGVEGREPHLFLATLFDRCDVVWIGDVHDSSRPGAESHFRTIEEWLVADRLGGPRTCPAIFRPNERCRRNDRTLTTPYIVIEADDAIGRTPETEEEKDLNRAANAALIRWCREGLGMQLAAIIDTGHKSLHGWFKRPSKKCIDELTEIAPVLGIDRLVSKPAQPVRLPGFLHEKSQRTSHLLWLADSLHD
ncbi:MAG: hypothetical protein KDN20_01500 [Verrucomicrobiae bacterium]|nr:hypothetical protein [Verrucomicrobiae bacterium]